MRRYPLPPLGGRTTVSMPAGAVPCGVERGGLFAVVCTDPNHSPTQRTFEMASTGMPLPDLGPYIGSFKDGMLTWHIFEVPP